MNLIRSFLIVAVVSVLLPPEASAVTCGAETTDARFHAVCALTRRCYPPAGQPNYDCGDPNACASPCIPDLERETWTPHGSGVLVRWTDPEMNQRIGILTARHFIDANGLAGQCVQNGLWWAYFPICPPPSDPFPCANICVGPNEDMFRVRIVCFTLPDGEFGGAPGTDGVLVGEIHPDDIALLCRITPMSIVTPMELGCCIGRQAFVAGWGKTIEPGCCACQQGPAGRLRVGATAITHVGCGTNGRSASIGFRSDCTPGVSCMAFGLDHDSGGALCVEMPDNSLAVVGIMQYQTSALMAAAHHMIAPPGSAYLCRPCNPMPVPCGDMDGDGREELADRMILDALEPWVVTPWCPGDMDGDGCAGTDADVKAIKDDPDEFVLCDQVCRGDVNRDGFVNSTDYDLIAAFLGTSQSLPCPCQTCSNPVENCPWDVDYDGDVGLYDLAYASGNYQCSQNSPGCGLSGPPCP